MRTVITRLTSASPYSQSRKLQTEKEQRQTSKDHEAACWRERMHVTDDGHVFIPPMAFKNCIAECAKFLGLQIPGKGKSTYTKHFEAGILVADPLVLDIKATDVQSEWLFVPSDGKRGGGKRVDKCFPVIPKWSGDVRWYILDDAITEEVFAKHLVEAGSFIGIGRFRPRNNGFYGRFKVDSIKWM